MANRAALEREIARVRADLERYKAENKEDGPKISSQEAHLASLLKRAAVPPSEAELEAAEVRKELAGLERGSPQDFQTLAAVRARLTALDAKVTQEEIAGGIPGQPDDDVPDGSSPPARGTRSPNEPPMHTRPSEADTEAVRAEIRRLEAESPQDAQRIAAAKARLLDMESRAEADDRAAAQRVTTPAFLTGTETAAERAARTGENRETAAARAARDSRSARPDHDDVSDREIANVRAEIARLDSSDSEHDKARVVSLKSRLADMERRARS